MANCTFRDNADLMFGGKESIVCCEGWKKDEIPSVLWQYEALTFDDVSNGE